MCPEHAQALLPLTTRKRGKIDKSKRQRKTFIKATIISFIFEMENLSFVTQNVHIVSFGCRDGFCIADVIFLANRFDRPMGLMAVWLSDIQQHPTFMQHIIHLPTGSLVTWTGSVNKGLIV